MENQPTFAILLLQMVETEAIPPQIRFSAALLFKNFIKRQWPEAESGKIGAEDRQLIKKSIVSLMTRVPEKLQLQLSEAVSVMAYHDFPDNWANLLDDLVSQLSPTNYAVNAGVLQTAHSIFKRYRYEFRSDELFIELKFVLSKFAQPFLQLFQSTDSLIDQSRQNANALKTLFNCVLLFCKIYFSLNFQDIPEFFEENMNHFMPLFLKYLAYENPLLVSDEDEDGILEKVKTSICEIVDIYAKKYEEVFTDLPKFVEAVWKLLTTLGLEPKNDQLVSTGITFLSSVAKHPRHRKIFESQESLNAICEKIILPNMQLRESDVELFEDDPLEYIRRDLEGSDADTRRRAAADLVRSLTESFDAQVTAIMGGYINHFLQKYSSNPTANWKDKDTAMYLLIAITARSWTAQLGATKTNEHINVPEMFTSQIIGDLQAPLGSSSVHPILKVDALKFLNTFRHQLSKDQIMPVFALLVSHISSPNYVVHTYAAVCIERILSMRVNSQPLFTSVDLKPFTEGLLISLFQLIEAGQTAEKVSENDYLMKTVMRVVLVSREEMLPYANVILGRLVHILETIAKNPSNPKFNHYVFESIGALVRYLSASNPSLVAEFEKLLHPAILAILQLDIPEFTPYVLQILAQLLEYNPTAGIPHEYQSLLQPLLLPALWENSGNIPALVRLLQAYLSRGKEFIVQINTLPAFLGIFQKLIASRLNDQYGFELLLSIFEYIPLETLNSYIRQIFNIILLRLQSGKTVKYVNGLLKFIFKLVCTMKQADGTEIIVKTLDSIQPKLFQMLMQTVLIPELKTLSGGMERKQTAVALVRFALTCENMKNDDYLHLCIQLLTGAVQIAKTPLSKDAVTVSAEEEDLYNADIDEAGYQSAFVRLHSISKTNADVIPDITNLGQYLKQQIQIAEQKYPQQTRMLLNGLPSDIQKDISQF